jgi:hypothetical protein
VDAGWVALAGGSSGQGEATLAYNVSANGQPSARSATVAVAGQNVQLQQDAAPCRFTLSRTSDTISAKGGTLSVVVTTIGGCSWNASSPTPWIGVATGQSGSASGTVGLAVGANLSPSARVGQVNIAGQTYTVDQDGATATPTPAPAPPAPEPQPDPGGSGDQAEFGGVVTNVSGRCPDLTFVVTGQTVATDRSTMFKDISCGDVAKGGRSVTGSGTTDADNVVHADIVKKAGGHDDE